VDLGCHKDNAGFVDCRLQVGHRMMVDTIVGAKRCLKRINDPICTGWFVVQKILRPKSVVTRALAALAIPDRQRASYSKKAREAGVSDYTSDLEDRVRPGEHCERRTWIFSAFQIGNSAFVRREKPLFISAWGNSAGDRFYY